MFSCTKIEIKKVGIVKFSNISNNKSINYCERWHDVLSLIGPVVCWVADEHSIAALRTDRN